MNVYNVYRCAIIIQPATAANDDNLVSVFIIFRYFGVLLKHLRCIPKNVACEVALRYSVSHLHQFNFCPQTMKKIWSLQGNESV